MKTKISMLFFAVVAGCLLSSCTDNRLTGKNNGGIVQYGVNTSFSVTLPGDANKNYTWKVTEINDAILEQTELHKVQNMNTDDGVIRIFTFNFRTKAVGTSVLKIIYFRETGETPVVENTFEIRVDVVK